MEFNQNLYETYGSAPQFSKISEKSLIVSRLLNSAILLKYFPSRANGMRGGAHEAATVRNT